MNAQQENAYPHHPRDWGRWGSEDQIGRANLLTPEMTRTVAGEIQTGRRYSLALPIRGASGDPCFPGREPASHAIGSHEGAYGDGSASPGAGGLRYVDDTLSIHCHGTTHMDALGHTYAGGTLWNGIPSSAAVGGLERAGIDALAQCGVVARAVLVDVPASKGRPHLAMREEICLADIESALWRQDTALKPGDALIIRTGIFKVFYEQGPDAFNADLDEPGLVYEPALVSFLAENDVVALGTDTMANERPFSETLNAAYPLHITLQHNLGVIFMESLWLEEWAADCEADRRYSAFLIAAPLRIVQGSAAPMNPIVIK